MLSFIATTWLHLPLGKFWAGADDTGVRFFEPCDCFCPAARRDALQTLWQARLETASHPHLQDLEQQLHAYFAGQRADFSVSLAPRGSEFQKRVWSQLRQIPFGETISYEQLAQQIGAPTAARAVARANATNGIAILIPCHRVIRKNGALSGYNGGSWRKQKLLELEKSVLNVRNGA